MRRVFRSLAVFNYRVWFAGAIVSNIGIWMYRTAQEWYVLAELSSFDATALGTTIALALGPQLALVGWTGVVVDRCDPRRLLVLTQIGQGVLVLGLGVTALSGLATIWIVWAFALSLGIITAFDAPARHAFVAQLVPTSLLPNAVSLNSVSFHGARMVGPALAGALLPLIGAGTVFVISGCSFIATTIALMSMRTAGLQPSPRASRTRGQLAEGIGYIWNRKDYVVIFVMVALIGTFGYNFAIYNSTMTSIEFNLGAQEYGIAGSVMAAGSVLGALSSARREVPRLEVVAAAAALFGLGLAAAAIQAEFVGFVLSIVIAAFAGLTFMNTSNALLQTTVEPRMRGRVMSIYLAIFMGGTPLGAPLVGWVVNTFGPRWGPAIGASAGVIAGLIGLMWILNSRRRTMPGA